VFRVPGHGCIRCIENSNCFNPAGTRGQILDRDLSSQFDLIAPPGCIPSPAAHVDAGAPLAVPSLWGIVQRSHGGHGWPAAESPPSSKSGERSKNIPGYPSVVGTGNREPFPWHPQYRIILTKKPNSCYLPSVKKSSPKGEVQGIGTRIRGDKALLSRLWLELDQVG